jgi:hypothetical protein
MGSKMYLVVQKFNWKIIKWLREILTPDPLLIFNKKYMCLYVKKY